MSENIKDLIEKAEKEEQSRAVMEKTIENLKIEVESLKSKLEEQTKPFKPPTQKTKEKLETSEELEVLKDMVVNLRKEVIQKDQEKEKLNKRVKDLSSEIEQLKEQESDSVKEQILMKTQNSLNNLITDYSRLESSNKSLKEKILELQQEINMSSELSDQAKSQETQSVELKKQIEALKNQISNLEEKNTSLLQNLNILESKSSSAETLGELIEKLKQNNIKLEEENKDLAEKLEELKRDKLRIMKYERKLSELNNKIQQLEETNKMLKERDSILLAKTITAMDKQTQKQRVRTIPQNSKPILEGPTTKAKPLPVPKPEKTQTKKPKKKVRPMSISFPLNRDDLLESEKPYDQVQVPKVESDEETTRKWQCPNCGNINKAQIRELDDKTRLIYSYPKIYAKKYVCGQCGKEWK